MIRFLLSLFFALECGSFFCHQAKANTAPSPILPSDYSYAYWLNSWRKHQGQSFQDILCFETDRFGIQLNIADLTHPHFGDIYQPANYLKTLKSGVQGINNLPKGELKLEIEHDGSIYRLISCEAAKSNETRHLKTIRLWESGSIAQHYDIQKLILKNDQGKPLNADTTLDIVVWPNSITLNTICSPTNNGNPSVWKNATLRLSLKNKFHHWHTEKKIPGEWKTGQTHHLSLNGNFNKKPVHNPALKLTATNQNKVTTPLTFNPSYNSYTADINLRTKNLQGGYRDVRGYHELTLHLENKSNALTRVPIHLHLTGVAQITGLCPILCHPDGTPTGIPVQLSKNWHYPKLGTYFRPYMIIPAKPGKTTYKLRIAYGFYGTLPSASHAQLSLIGYANNTRWDQLAIGCWGETICFDMDTACVPNVITDVRGLMLRNGKNGRKWHWTDCGWGGDWLHIRNAKKQRLHLSELKTAYLAHGPCLTDVRHTGYYGTQREVKIRAQVQTCRTDDYARTFQTLNYTFQKAFPARNITLFALGDRTQVHTPCYAYGDLSGLHKEVKVPTNAKKDSLLLDHYTLTGTGPWWIAFPKGKPHSKKDWGTGTRALIIRSYQANFGGKKYLRPSISMRVNHDLGQGKKSINLYLTPPKEVTTISPNDTVSIDTEWITLPRIADDYYGTNKAFLEFLQKHPNSWRPVHREVVGNHLSVSAKGGHILKNYPLIIKANQPEVTFTIKGGVGYVPVRIENLKSPDGYKLYQIINGKAQKLDQAVHGNDFWQTDYNTRSQRYQISYNLPLDNLAESTWLLTKDPSH